MIEFLFSGAGCIFTKKKILIFLSGSCHVLMNSPLYGTKSTSFFSLLRSSQGFSPYPGSHKILTTALSRPRFLEPFVNTK